MVYVRLSGTRNRVETDGDPGSGHQSIATQFSLYVQTHKIIFRLLFIENIETKTTGIKSKNSLFTTVALRHNSVSFLTSW
jgi:hypothetical protein